MDPWRHRLRAWHIINTESGMSKTVCWTPHILVLRVPKTVHGITWCRDRLTRIIQEWLMGAIVFGIMQKMEQ